MESIQGNAEWLTKGHSKEVLSVEFGGVEDCLVVTASEDGTSRVWDLRTNKSVRMLRAESHAGIPVNHAVFAGESAILTAVGNAVLKYDLRNEKVILSKCNAVADDRNKLWEDEINEIDTHRDGEHFVAGDDSGNVCVAKFGSTGQVEPLRKERAHSSVCYSVRFNPKEDWSNFVSGGFDTCARVWGGDRDGATVTVGLADDPNAVTSVGTQLVNPPFINSVSFSGDASLLAYGIGDSTIGLTRTEAIDNMVSRFGAHLGAVTQAKFGKVDPMQVDGQNLLISAGADKYLKLWSLKDLDDSINHQLQWATEFPFKINRTSISCTSTAIKVAAVFASSKMNPLILTLHS